MKHDEFNNEYSNRFLEQASRLCKLGMDEGDMATFFGVDMDVLNAWKQEFPEFAEMIEKGKTLADAVVAEALYLRATGYSHPEDKVFNHEGDALIVPTTKRYPPDTMAAIFWLKNRRPDLWRDKLGVEHAGTVTWTSLLQSLNGPASEPEATE